MSAPKRRLLRPGIEDVPAYATSALTAAVRLDRNESPEELAPDLRENVLSALAAARWSRYPDAHGSDLKAALAAREGLPAEAVVVGNGSNSLFLSLFVAAAFPGRRIGICPLRMKKAWFRWKASPSTSAMVICR